MLSAPSRRMAIAACTAAFAFPALADTPTINTYSSWDGTAASPFGCPDITTFGQVITVPSGLHHLNKFTFSWQKANGSSGPMVVRAYVYRWDGTNAKAKGSSLFESSPRTIAFSDLSFHAEGFSPPAIAVTPGAQYVVFASIDREYVDCKNGYALGWGVVTSDVYSGGTLVSQSNTGDDLQWTGTAWDAVSGYDLAFKAYLSP